ncbi:hypothetical protein RND71_003466 [Anisodus tanguticus]|uniref:Pectinesterase n=1 Tax=Anisodus tanguticus TaxID=243964 RepID=A0AAE1VX38_9SOLA|nr:hypothetical protein RND71_003466 [Anisodus tanguticus]
MANHQTCLNGFHDFKFSYLEKFPLGVGDFSKYLFNSLAINKATTSVSTKHQLKGRRLSLSQVFPEWLSVVDRRKRLQTSKGAPKADIVVAQDAVSRSGFIAKDITFENTAGPQKHQAVALCSGSYFSVFYACSFKGYQDTLYVHSNRQFYRDCDIYGTVDFIFGDAIAVFQNCNIYVRKPMSNQKNTVTAQARNSPDENTGIIMHGSRVTAASDLRPVQCSFKTYLGRPWKQYSRTLFIKSTIDSLIDPVGWLPWSGEFALKTLYYGEYMNTGAGAGTGNRRKWPGYHDITNVMEAGKFSVGNFLAGDSWLPTTGLRGKILCLKESLPKNPARRKLLQDVSKKF